MKSKLIEAHEIVVPLDMRRLKSGEYLATSRVLRGLVAQGRTMAEAVEIAQDVARKLIESYQEHGDPLPSALRRQKSQTKTAHLQVPVAGNF